MPQHSLPPALFLMGPTASGKTDLAVCLLDHFDAEIISVDSAQVYRGLDIGTAKPDARLLARAPHRLIDIRDPNEAYSAAEFRADALAAMQEINARGRIPLLVGGTGLYFKALLYGLSDLPAADAAVRARLEQDAARHGWDAMHQRLRQLDPVAAKRIHPHDPQRIGRALEVYELTGRPISALQSGLGEPTLPYRVLKLVRAVRNRELLRARIGERFSAMLDKGLEREVRGLLARPDMSPASPSLRSVGYRQMVMYLNGQYDAPTLEERGIIATRQLAKRQLTWLRREPGAHWLYDEDGDVAERAVRLIGAWLAGTEA
jgi:tRNA dimethylallyltransferase